MKEAYLGMPIIRIDYDSDKVVKDKIQELSKVVKDIVSNATDIANIFVYANSSKLR
jgi:hypothetical protein